MAINDEYSFKDFTGQSLVDVDPAEFNGKGDIVGTCFAQEMARDDSNLSKEVFPEKVDPMRFVRCNLDNAHLPGGSDTEGCSMRRIKVQNDNEDWVLDIAGKPTEPVDKIGFLKDGKSTDPKDIPALQMEA